MSRFPVVLSSYSRVDTTRRVLERIAAANPPILFVLLDAVRPEAPPDEISGCAAVRALVEENRGLPEVRVNVSAVNLGPGRRLATGLAWVFEQVAEAMVLEDDCLPDPSFFPYCDEMLERYRDVERVMMISGDNYQFGQRRGSGSYYYSCGVGTHGWATWARAFRNYDFDMSRWPGLRESELISEVWPEPEAASYWRARLDEAFSRAVDTWDYQWALSIWSNHGLQIVPNRNLVSYLGCTAGASNTSDALLPFCALPTEPLDPPFVSPRDLERDLVADLYEFHRIFARRSHEESVRRSEARVQRQAERNGGALASTVAESPG